MGRPAARIGDMHTCPQWDGHHPHVGGPIAAGAGNVLINGRPAARIGDMATCQAPPDAIAGGAGNVLIAGRPAARLGDGTVHGGVVVAGSGNVMIGGGGSAPTSQSPDCASLADALNKAILANHTYGNAELPIGYREVKDPSELKALGLGDDPGQFLSPQGSSFRAEIFAEDGPNGTQYVVAYRGTQTAEDWENNLEQGIGLPSDEYQRAVKLANKVDIGSGGRVSFTGHSLGGGMASAASVATGQTATTFNSAGLNAQTVGGYPATPAPVDAYYSPDDPLSNLQDNRATILGGMSGGAALVNPALGGGLAGYILGNEAAGSPVLPQAYGTRHALPTPPMPAFGLGDVLHPIRRLQQLHSMERVIDGIRQQQARSGCR